MNRRMIIFLLGRILMIEAVLMLPSVLVGLIYREAITWCFLPAIGVLALLGLFGVKKPKDTTIYAREGFLTVGAAWLLMSLFGAVPLWLCGGFDTFWDCLFEIVSGFTTTGASILETVEQLPHCILFWRSFSHWIGGMGVLVFVLAVMPMSEERSMHLMRAEVPGPVVGKLVPRMRDTAKILYAVYTVLTLILIVLLCAGGMPLFESVCHAFGAAGTGGFSVRNLGIKAYDSTYIHVVLSTFMLLFGVNFTLYHLILIGKWRNALKSEELHVYLGIVIATVVLITLNTLSMTDSFGLALRNAYFQVSSIITTTGYATVNFDLWPGFSKMILLLLMVCGACAGSTGGGGTAGIAADAASARDHGRPHGGQADPVGSDPCDADVLPAVYGVPRDGRASALARTAGFPDELYGDARVSFQHRTGARAGRTGRELRVLSLVGEGGPVL